MVNSWIYTVNLHQTSLHYISLYSEYLLLLQREMGSPSVQSQSPVTICFDEDSTLNNLEIKWDLNFRSSQAKEVEERYESEDLGNNEMKVETIHFRSE